MTNTYLLEDFINRSGYTKKQIAELLGLSITGFIKKVKNRNEFKASEIMKLKSLLNLTDDDVTSIFFTH